MSAPLHELLDEFDEWRRREQTRNEGATPTPAGGAPGGVGGQSAVIGAAVNAGLEEL
jgi:hypothetical protein